MRPTVSPAPPVLVGDGWGASGAFHLLKPKVLRQVNEWFRGYNTAEKVQCLLSLLHAKAAHLEKSAETMQSIIDQALIDPDQWVQGLARLLNGFPRSAAVQCAQVDNEFVYRLIEVVKLHRPPRWLQPKQAEFITPGPSPQSGAVPLGSTPPRQWPVDCHSKRSADAIFQHIEDKALEQARAILDTADVASSSGKEDMLPKAVASGRGFVALPWSDEAPRKEKREARTLSPRREPTSGSQRELPARVGATTQRQQQQQQQQQAPATPSGPMAEQAPPSPAQPELSAQERILARARRARSSGGGPQLQWDVEGLEAAEREVVEPLIRPASPDLRQAQEEPQAAPHASRKRPRIVGCDTAAE